MYDAITTHDVRALPELMISGALGTKSSWEIDTKLDGPEFIDNIAFRLRGNGILHVR